MKIEIPFVTSLDGERVLLVKDSYIELTEKVFRYVLKAKTEIDVEDEVLGDTTQELMYFIENSVYSPVLNSVLLNYDIEFEVYNLHLVVGKTQTVITFKDFPLAKKVRNQVEDFFKVFE